MLATSLLAIQKGRPTMQPLHKAIQNCLAGAVAVHSKKETLSCLYIRQPNLHIHIFTFFHVLIKASLNINEISFMCTLYICCFSAPSQRPRIISSVRSGSRYIITWDHVKAMSNESAVEGYKVWSLKIVFIFMYALCSAFYRQCWIFVRNQTYTYLNVEENGIMLSNSNHPVGVGQSQ